MLVFVSEFGESLVIGKGTVDAFLRELGGVFGFWRLFFVDKNILVTFGQTVNPYGGTMREECAVLFYFEGYGERRGFTLPRVQDEGGIVTGS